MQKTIVKKVRLTPQEAKQLTRLAKRRKTTESEVLREGLRGMDRIEKRNASINKLIELAEEETEPWKKPDIDVKW